MSTQEIIRLYTQDLLSISELARISNYSTYMVKKILTENGVKIKTRAEQNVITNQKRKKAVNETYFSNINSVNQAWLLGFLAADGAIRKNKNEIKIGLSSVDREILEKIQKELSIERKILDTITQKGFFVSELTWSSKQQKEDLAKFGIVNNKTYLEMRLPDLGKEELTLAFILGFFDGDGSFSISDRKYCRFRLCAHRNELLVDIANFLKSKYGTATSLNQDHRGLWELSISTKYAVKILDDMYNLNSLRLDRKYQKFLEYKTQATRL